MTVVYHAPQGAGSSLRYQRYYQLGLAEVTTLEWTGSRAGRLLDRIARRSSDAGHVGRYEADGVKFVIDARDNHALDDDDALAWADVYFKANRWRAAEYPPRVLPIVNGNGFVGPREIDLLRSLRDTPKDVDIAFISNLWGGREHNVRLLEELAAMGVAADLLAVLPEGADPAEDAALAARLAASGVQATTRQVPIGELWRRLARARVVLFRSGKHLCIPWRMIDLLAMGACVLFDAEPLPQWPVPLIEGAHYASCGIDRPAWELPAPSEYGKVAPAVASLLGDAARRTAVARAAARYFDDHASPRAVGEYVLAAILGGR